MMKECRYYKALNDGSVRCELCPHRCHLQEGGRGICGSRRNKSGKLMSEVYGEPCALAIDPIEKKPLAMFHPGTTCLSLACTGCNLRCRHCQNHDISQAMPFEVRHAKMSPEQLVEACKANHCPGIAYTYTEPLTWFEYTYDTAELAHEAGLWNILVTAGYINPEPARDMAKVIDAANIDLKYFSEEIYHDQSKASLKPVLDTILIFHEEGVHIELTNLIIPGVNDDMDMIRDMCRWLKAHDLADCPLHLTRFFPMYKMQESQPTPLHTLQQAKEIAKEEGIRHVLLGNC